MVTRKEQSIGVIYGNPSAVSFQIAATDPSIRRLDYVAAEHPSGIALAQIVEVSRQSSMSFDDAVRMARQDSLQDRERVSCTARVLGYRDERGLLQLPRTPFRPGTTVQHAKPRLIQKVLGLSSKRDGGAFLGLLKGTEIPVVLDINTLVQKHVSVLAKTGAGKSYTVGVLVEELLKQRVPLVVADPHGEYTSLSNPNLEDAEIESMARFNVKPRGFQKHVTEYTLDEFAAGRQQLELSGESLSPRELADILPTKLTSAQVGLLHQAVNALKVTKRLYRISDIVNQVEKSQSNAKWALVSSLESLEQTGLFGLDGTSPGELVRPGHAAILNLKGQPPEIQQVVVARLARVLFEARKAKRIPPFMFVVEEAHNFAPERGFANAVSGADLRTIASEGRKFGMGLLIVSQRPAKIDKNVLSQCNTQIVMKVTNPNDLRAITSSVEGINAGAASELQRLGVGVSMVVGGNLVAPVFVDIRTRQTRHGGRSVNVLVGPEDGPDVEQVEAWRADAAVPDPEPVPTRDVDEIIASAVAAHAEEAAVEPPLEDAEPATASDGEHPGVFVPPGPWSPEAAPLDFMDEPSNLDRGAPSPSLDAEASPSRDDGATGTPSAASATMVETIHEEEMKEPVLEAPDEAGQDGPELRPSDASEEEVLMRVVTRVGYQRVRSPRDAIRRVRRFAKRMPRLTPSEYLRRFVQVGRIYCQETDPECGPCPLLDTCKLGQDRRARGEIRAGRWGSRT